MRNLINMLTEATGLAGRSTGDIFKDENDNEIIFRDLKFFPDAGKFEKDQVVPTVAQVAEELQRQGIEVAELNSSNGMGGFGVAQFSYPDGSIHAYIKYFKQIAPNHRDNFWNNSSIPGLRLGARSSEKLRAGYSPTDVLTKFDGLSAEDIVAQIGQKFGQDNVLTQIALAVSRGGQNKIEVPSQGINFVAFRDLFCELLHPIALKSGFFTGSATSAEQKFLGAGGFQQSSISFGSSKTEGLSDSLLTGSEGRIIKVSSKNKVGSAKASVTNISSEARKLESNPDSQKLLVEYQDTLAIINLIEQQSAVNAPLTLAVQFKIINDKDSQAIMNLSNGQYSWMSINENLDSLPWMSPALKKLWALRTPRNPDQATPFYHMVSACAHSVAEHINKKTDFGKAASIILNNGALVQVYTNAEEKNDKIILLPFDTQYPSETVTGVIIEAGTRYKSTSIDGKMGFQILKNGGKPVVTDDEIDGAPPTALKVKPISDPEKTRVQITPKGRTPISRDKDSTPRQRRDK